MAPESNASNNLDEHLENLRDKSLNDGEQVIIQAMGDHGQAIVFTDSRVIILKAGITATGSLNGEKATIFANEEISCIKLRRGPLGAVIQVISTQASDDPQTTPPGNILIFNGDDKVKKCKALAATMENNGLTIERIGFENETVKKTAKKTVSDNISNDDEIKPQQTPAKKKIQKSLAEEMYDEITNENIESKNTIQPFLEEQKSEETTDYMKIDFDLESPDEQKDIEQFKSDKPVISKAIIEEISSVESQIDMPAHVEVTPITNIGESAEKTSQLADFRPNPRLPKPVPQTKNSKSHMLVLFGLLAIIVIGGIAFMKPVNEPVQKTKVTINTKELTLSPESINKQLSDIDRYKYEASKIVKTSNEAARGFVGAYKSKSNTAHYDEVLDKAWKKIDSLSAPSGLAAVKQNLTKALYEQKTIVVNTETGFNENLSQTMNALSKIEKTTKQSFKKIDEACAKLRERNKQAAKKK